jgi:hypothetical protein
MVMPRRVASPIEQPYLHSLGKRKHALLGGQQVTYPPS